MGKGLDKALSAWVGVFAHVPVKMAYSVLVLSSDTDCRVIEEVCFCHECIRNVYLTRDLGYD